MWPPSDVASVLAHIRSAPHHHRVEVLRGTTMGGVAAVRNMAKKHWSRIVPSQAQLRNTAVPLGATAYRHKRKASRTIASRKAASSMGHHC